MIMSRYGGAALSGSTYPSPVTPGCSSSSASSSSLPSDNINYWLDQYSHSQSTRKASGEGLTMSGGTYFEGVEFTEWRMVRNLVGAVLPAPIQDRLRQFSSGHIKAVPKGTHGSAGTGAQTPPRSPATPRRTHSADEAVTEFRPPLPPRRRVHSADEATLAPPVLPERRAVNTGFDGGKWFSSLLASVAVSLEPGEGETSGVDWRSGSQGRAPTPFCSISKTAN